MRHAAQACKARGADFYSPRRALFLAYRAEGVRRACLRGQYSSVAPSGMGKDGEESARRLKWSS